MSDEDKIFDEFEQYCEEITKAATEWQLRWPNACKSCYGRGGASWVEMHGFTHGAGEQMWDICSCVNIGKCPRCDAWAWIWTDDNMESEVPCRHCGWNWGKGKDDACPEI